MYKCCCSHHHCKPCRPCESWEPETPPIQIAPPTPGGWTSWLPLTSNEEQIFYAAIQGLIGANYIPCAVQSQAVAGRNYLFLAKREVMTGNGLVIGLVTIAVSVDAQGNITRGAITQIGN